MLIRKLISSTAILLVFCILLTGCNQDVATSSNIAGAGSVVNSSSVSSQKANTSTESTVSWYIPKTVEESLQPHGVNGIDGPIKRVEAIQITEMPQKEILDVYEQESELDLPDSIKFEPGGEVDFVYIPHEDKGYCESLIVFTNLVAYVSENDANNILNQLEKAVEWKTDLIGHPRKNIQNIIDNTSNNKYAYYERYIRSLVNSSLFTLGILLMEDVKTGKYMMVTDGITNNRTYKNGLITIK